MAKAADFLVEIGTEELPPKSLKQLADSFLHGVTQGLQDAGLAFTGIEGFATPRRLAVLVRDLAHAQPEREIENRGPPVRIAFDAQGAPTRAALAFAETVGVTVDALQRERTDKGEWLLHRARVAGKAAEELVPDIVQHALDGLPVARRMRWGDTDFTFVRPVHWIVMLHGTQVVPATLFGLASGRTTRGHRFLAQETIELRSPAEYVVRLETEGFVLASFAARRERLLRDCEALAAEQGGTLVGNDALLDEVASLVEWPQPIAGRIEARYLELPPEVLITTLQNHQRYFPLRGPGGALLPTFIAVANLRSLDPAQIRAGNERVVRPRLADAAFFYAQDRQKPLADRIPDLERVVFQKNLGTMATKSRRVADLAVALARGWNHDPGLAERAALLARCDLLTDMVGEFPELQGRMGRYYAEHDGEAAEVAAAIEEQYLPRFAGDRLPATATGQVLALAEKLDTLAGSFAISQRPSGNRDPFALRRAALGVMRILIEGELELDLPSSLRDTVARQPGPPPPILADELHEFLLERLRGYYGDGAVPVSADVLNAVLELRPASLLDAHLRILALAESQGHPDMAALAAANKRVANILRKSGSEAASQVDPRLLKETEEKALFQALHQTAQQVEPLREARRYRDALTALAGLRPAIDGFFDKVMVMDPDAALRANRLALLAALRSLFLGIADLSRLPG